MSQNKIARLRYNAADERAANIIGSRIAELRKSKGYTLTDMSICLSAYGIDIKPTSINKWEMGDSVPSAYQLMAICQAFEISDIDTFTSYRRPPEFNEEGLKKLADYRSDLLATGKYAYHPQELQEIRYVDMPVSSLAVSAGTGNFLDSGEYETISFPADSIPAGAEFGVRVGGDSMEPVYHDGQIVWVKSCPQLNPGDVGIFVYDGEGYIKVYGEQIPADSDAFTDSYGVTRRQPVMISYNKKYAPRVISPDADFRIVGRVLH